MLRGDLRVDPATGLPNLFGLLEWVHQQAGCGDCVVLIADVAGLSHINAVHGRRVGDACVRALAGALRAEPHLASLAPPATAFRIGGDEFLVALPGVGLVAAGELATSLEERFRFLMAGHGVPDAGLHLAITACAAGRPSAASLLNAAYLALEGCRPGADMPSTLPCWAENLIDSMADRICGTLSLLDEARNLALSDEVSGLPNHRAADAFLADMLLRHAQTGEPCSVLLVDGDNLKAYNDMGYQRGNQMIRDLATVLAAAVRHGDQLTRWLSGDEFVVLLPGADRSVAAQVGERLRASVEVASVPWPLPVTVSVGVATCPADGSTAEQLLARAEAANAAAKRAGKNRVA